MSDIKVIKMYLHRSADSNWDMAQQLWDPPVAERMYQNGFKYALAEVECDVEVNMITGDARLLGVREEGGEW